MKVNAFIDHTILSPFTTTKQIDSLCQEAIDYAFYAICISPYFVSTANSKLKDTSVKISTVISFPYGHDPILSKKACMNSTAQFVDEFDVVVNLQAVVNENWDLVQQEIHELTSHAHSQQKIIKWIVESGNINKQQLARLCDICNEARVDFMKTSTGALGPGAVLFDVRFMRQHLDDSIAIKASGGIRDFITAASYIEAGARRIGTSSGVKIVREQQNPS